MSAEHCKDILVSAGMTFGGSGQWSVWIGKQPASPDRVVTLYDAGGKNPDPRWLLDYPSVQIRVRGGQGDYKVAKDKAVEVRNKLLGIASFTAGNGDRIVSITGLGDIGFTGFGQNDRPEHVFNLNMIIEPAQAAPPTHRDPL